MAIATLRQGDRRAVLLRPLFRTFRNRSDRADLWTGPAITRFSSPRYCCSCAHLDEYRNLRPLGIAESEHRFLFTSCHDPHDPSASRRDLLPALRRRTEPAGPGFAVGAWMFTSRSNAVHCSRENEDRLSGLYAGFARALNASNPRRPANGRARTSLSCAPPQAALEQPAGRARRRRRRPGATRWP